MKWDGAVSPQSLFDFVNDAGRDFGLVGVVDETMGRVFVSELEPLAWSAGGLGDCSYEVPGRRICSIDEGMPFDRILNLRIMPGETDPSERYKRAREAEQAKGDKEFDDRWDEFFSVTKRRRAGGQIFYPKMNEALALNRKARRIREAMRRQGGR